MKTKKKQQQKQGKAVMDSSSFETMWMDAFEQKKIS